MKNILLIAALAASLTANAQTDSASNPCEGKITTEVDKFTDDTSTFLTSPIMTPNGNITVMIGARNTFIFSFSGIEKGCIDENTECIFLFEDGTKLTMYANNKFNCTGRIAIYTGNIWKNRTFFNAVSSYKISAIRIRTRNGPAQIDLTPEQTDELFDGIKCLNYQYK